MTARAALERLRTRLLDLSGNNPLLNFKLTSARSLRFVDEVPSQVFARLTDDRPMVIAPLPGAPKEAPTSAVQSSPLQPTLPLSPPNYRPHGSTTTLDEGTHADPGIDDEETASTARRRAERSQAADVEARGQRRARELGLTGCYELPAADAGDEPHHTDNKLQTLLDAKALETRLRGIQKLAATHIEERGANILHLVFGFLEWKETGVAGARARFAPLILLPVELVRGQLDPRSGTYQYGLKSSGEDWSVNITLQEKLRRDFRIELPNTDESETLEAYFQRVAIVIKNAPIGWAVHRQITLGLLSFGKLMMWLDLMPEKWGELRGPMANAHSLRFLGYSSDETDVGVPETRTTSYAIDDLTHGPSGAPILVTDADTSQHSVLIDVAKGDSIVVQGPPGTGKSQTITNLIGAALASGKRVLFVAEKKAALDVVERRLADAGLGDFALALHSHKSDKRAVIKKLGSRLEQNYAAAYGRPSGPADGSTQPPDGFEAVRATLRNHAQILNAPFGAICASPFDLVWRVRANLAELPVGCHTAVRRLRFPASMKKSSGEIADDLQTLDAYVGSAARLKELGFSRADHPWRGIRPTSFAPTFLDELVKRARTWLDEVEKVCTHSAQLVALAEREGALLSAARTAQKTLLDITQLAQAALDCPVLPPTVPPSLPSKIVALPNYAEVVPAALKAVDASKVAWSKVTVPDGAADAFQPAKLPALRRVLDMASSRIDARTSISEVAALRNRVLAFLESLKYLAATAEALSETMAISSPTTPQGALLYIQAAQDLSALTETFGDLRHDGLDTAGAASALSRLASEADALHVTDATLRLRFGEAFRPPLSALRAHSNALTTAPRLLPGLISGAFRNATRAYRAMSGGKLATRAQMIAEVGALVTHLDALESWSTRPELLRLAGPHAAGHKSPLTALAEFAAWRSRMSARAEVDSDARGVLEGLWVAPSSLIRRIAHRITSGAESTANHVSQLHATLDTAVRFTSASRAVLESAVSNADLKNALGRSISDVTQAANSVAQWSGALLELASKAGFDASKSLSELRGLVDRVELAAETDRGVLRQYEVLQALDVIEHQTPLEAIKQKPLDTSAVVAGIGFINAVRKSELPKELSNWLISDSSPERIAAVRKLGSGLRRATTAADRASASFAEAAVLEADWLDDGGIGDVNEAPLSLVRARLSRSLSHVETLHAWAQFASTETSVASRNLQALVELYQNRTLEAEQIHPAYLTILYESLLAEALDARPSLAKFNGAEHEAARARFAQLDTAWARSHQRTIGDRVRSARVPVGVTKGKVAELTDAGLISNEARKQKRHVPIRELFRRAGGAITVLTPCLMMSPQTVAQFLAPGAFEFDIVIMDEASQLRPEDALGAIVRGRQLVIVGDPQQLGPSSFFDTALQDVDELAALPTVNVDADDIPPKLRGQSPITVTEQQESILSAAASLYPMRVLRWHYRSQHPSLIEFSNRFFYERRLFVFPSARATDPGLGVVLHRLETATYTAGTNNTEALAVTAAVRRHAAESPARSLIVVAMNADQASMIDGLVLQAEKTDAPLAAFKARHDESLEPFAIKSLENVQGDERDVVMISLTYGPDASGRLSQQFGPINKDGGDRRLNVLFSRAKQQLHLFASFGPEMLRVESTSPRGLQVLHEYLKYAEGGTWGMEQLSSREPDSPFEVAMSTALARHGLDVVPQVGVAGYFIDMAIRHPDFPGRFILGIECDGETYHRSASARERDRLRDEHLARLGWTLHRVWSTDFYSDPEGQVQRIVERVRRMRAGP